MLVNNKTRLLTILVVVVGLILMNVGGDTSRMLAAAGKSKSDILFLKGKFILKDKKGSIVISDEKKPCHCPHYYR